MALRKVTSQEQALFAAFFEQANQVIIGKDKELKLALTCFLARGHLLIEDLPGMGKTTFALLIGQLLGLSFSRVQFTNDLLPGDIIGTNIYDPIKKNFEFHKGPIFSELVLGDELNRATPKTQSAFLQAMEEQKVTADGKTYPLPNPFFLIATQNPTFQTGTYPLPESQLDRFMMCLHLGYPDHDSERKILLSQDPRMNLFKIKPLFTKSELIELQTSSQKLHVSPSLLDFTQNILSYSRQYNQNQPGLSPRAGLLLLQAARSHAFVEGREMVLPEDIQAVAPYVMSHRLVSSETQSFASGESRALEILSKIPVP